jgi:hypothetical protein
MRFLNNLHRYLAFQSSDMSVPDKGYYVPDKGYYVPDKGYYVPDEGYYVPDEGYYVPDEGYYVPDEGYYVHAHIGRLESQITYSFDSNTTAEYMY